jgi:sterol desaturase/sphingolipid hydroxylase (fatty acid hydroxylase superfamily)
MIVLLTALGAVVGAFAWTLVEYWIHRRKHARRASGPEPRGHHRHHAEPSYFLPLLTKVITAVAVLVPTATVAVLTVGVWAGGGFAGGLTVAYLFYERIHWTSHYLAPRTGYGRQVRRNHFTHHFSHPKQNYGFTTAFWDRLFHTFVRVDQVQVPRRHALPWLVTDGKVRPEFARDYVLVGRSSDTEPAAATEPA